MSQKNLQYVKLADIKESSLSKCEGTDTLESLNPSNTLKMGGMPPHSKEAWEPKKPLPSFFLSFLPSFPPSLCPSFLRPTYPSAPIGQALFGVTEI
jgi:hypothetical protein